MGTRVQVRVVEQPKLAAELLGRQPGVKNVKQTDGQILVELGQDEHDFTDIVRVLLANNFRIHEVREEEVNLETAFMRLTKGLVQ